MEATAQIERVVARFQMQGIATLAALASDPTFQALIALFPRLLQRCTVGRDEVAVMFARQTLKRMIDSRTVPIAIELFIFILKIVRSLSPAIVPDLTKLFFTADDDVKFQRDMLLPLLRERILSVVDFDMHLATLMNASTNGLQSAALMEVAVVLIRVLMMNEQVFKPQEMPHTLYTLHKLAQRGKVEPLFVFLQQVEQISVASQVSSPPGTPEF